MSRGFLLIDLNSYMEIGKAAFSEQPLNKYVNQFGQIKSLKVYLKHVFEQKSKSV